MSTNRYLRAPLIILGALTLSACAAKQVWVPELDEARNAYEQISQDTVVSSLALEELQAAQQQLAAAEAASDQFKKAEQIRHEAKLARLRALVAQQRARALSANHSLQIAMGQQPLLPEDRIAAATVTTSPVEEFANLEADSAFTDEPLLAAAHDSAEPEKYPAGSIEAQLLELKLQVDSLQAQLENRNLTDETLPTDTTTDTIREAPFAAELQADSDTAAIVTLEEVEPVIEPVMAAAIPAATVEPMPMPSADRLHQELQAMNARAGSRGMSLTLGERYFAGGSARLWDGRAARHLDNVAAVLTENPALNLEIEAHTDNIDGSDENLDLSVNRAVAIKSALVLRGVSEDRINAVGFGDSRPLADNSSELGRLQNRRVELVFPNVPVRSL
ncbi:hypothetical protein AB833_16395 [Chromatiales bacterium (ex Bugula neritina AB1)]|nr:hypothetical protein AB833_16395 [Chromatiales bacterium (ex Bugula neritina AB1)]